MKPTKQPTVSLLVALLLCATPVFAMEMHAEGNQLILTGPLYGFEMTQFGSALTPNVTTVVFRNSGGGEFAAGLNLAATIRQKGLTTVAQGYCSSSCANAFLGGVNRYLADSRSYVGFHGHYTDSTTPSQSNIGAIRNFYTEYTGGKVSDDLVLLWMQKPRTGLIYFYKHTTYSCNGREPKRPRGCEKIPQRAIEQGIITSLDDVVLRDR